MSIHPQHLEPLYVLQRAEIDRARVNTYLEWLRGNRDLDIETWEQLHAWSISDLSAFWQSMWDYFGIRAHTPPEAVLEGADTTDPTWFRGATLNYAEHSLGEDEDRDVQAVIAYSQTRDPRQLTFGELREQVARARAGLKELGVGRGDRVVGYLPNCPETLVAFLATASLGAVWAACAPEFGALSVIDRFAQIEPTVLITISGYTYGEKQVDKRPDVEALRRALPTLKHVVHVPYGPTVMEDALGWETLLDHSEEPLKFEPVPFDHPLCVLFSSGTTGRPKAIVHSHGGILIEQLKSHSFHWDLGPGDRLLWFTTTAWMMWNVLVAALLVRSSIVMIDGNPLHPDLRSQWRLSEETGATVVGASPGYLMACRQHGVKPTTEFDLSRVRQIGVAGSPFPAEGFRWVFENFGDRVFLNVGSGGTDVCTGIVQGSPLQPVWSGEMAGASLGVDAVAFNDEGKSVVGELGELVIRTPMPSMPVRFWGDDGSRRDETYFSKFPGVFTFGDWCRFSSQGTCVITGRSDATLNRGGVRLGTADFYRVLQDVDEIADSVVIHLEDPHAGLGDLILFIVPAPGVAIDAGLQRRILATIRTALSPRHVPDHIVEVPSVPYSRTGKKLEIPVKRVLQGARPEDVASPDALQDPHALHVFVPFAQRDWRA